MQIDPALQRPADNYKLLTNLIVPRPIAWISTLNADGSVNLAPFSFFNAVASQPLYLAFSAGRHPDGRDKDTARNLRRSGEFVVSMVTEPLFAAMNLSAAEFPPEESEVLAAGLETAPGVKVQVPRVTASPVSMECRLHTSLELGHNTLFIGEVLLFHVADALVGERLHIQDFAPLGRLGSPSVYCRTHDRFDEPRLSYAAWLAAQTGQD
ncbi:MAG: hypothetical protein RIR00_981 [Pseudomonadota bacterium]|jgi:flavin reductase (DIM6/NTAB) family NADH-FMN oxidoreductase RutF